MITCEKLKEVLHYDPETGVFKWNETLKCGRNNAFTFHRAGERCGFIGGGGYRYITFNNYKQPEHRLAWLYMTGSLP